MPKERQHHLRDKLASLIGLFAIAGLAPACGAPTTAIETTAPGDQIDDGSAPDAAAPQNNAPTTGPLKLEVPAAPDPSTSTYAVIDLATDLRAGPDDGAELIPFGLLRDEKNGKPLHVPAVVRLIEMRGEMALVETQATERDAPFFQCHAGHPGLQALALQVLVPVKNLELVTTATIERDLRKRSGVTLQPGLRVRKAGKGARRYRVATYPGKPLKLDPQSVGHTFTPVANFSAQASGHGLALNAPARFSRLGDGTHIDVSLTVQFDVVSPAAKGHTAFAHQGCLRYRLFVPAKWMTAFEGQTIALPPQPAEDPGGPRVIAGAPAHWRSGEPAGHLRTDQTFREDAGLSGARRCLRKSIIPVAAGSNRRQFPEHDFVLCFDPAHVIGPHLEPLPRPPELTVAKLLEKTSGTYLIEGKVSHIYECAKCPKNKICYACEDPNISFSDSTGMVKIFTTVQADTPHGPPGALRLGNHVRLFVKADGKTHHLVRIESVVRRAWK